MGLAAVTLAAGTTIDTDSGVVRSGGQVVAVATETVPQTGGATIRVFSARTLVINDTIVTGSLPVAFVAHGS